MPSAAIPPKVGLRVQDVPGIDGDSLMADIMAQAELRRVGSNMTTSTQQPAGADKMSYVCKHAGLYWGCGVTTKSLVMLMGRPRESFAAGRCYC